MKKTLITAISIGFMMVFATSCGTTKNVQSAADSYDDSPAIESEETDEKGEAIVNNSDNKKPAKKKNNVLKEMFTFGNRDEYSKFYEISLFEKEITGLKEKRATTVIRTDDYMAGWGSYFSLAYYYVQFDADARKRVISAIDSYFNDFEQKNLQRKGKKTDRAYGKVKYRIDWGSISTTTPNKGVGEGYLGYEFIKGSPYFVISNYAFANDNYDRIGESTSRESMALSYYFTKAQLKELKEFLSDENINKLIGEMNENFVDNTADVY